MGGAYKAIINIPKHTPTAGSLVTIGSVIDSAKEITVNQNILKYYSQFGGTFIIKTTLGLQAIPATNSKLNIINYPCLPGANGNIDLPVLIPNMTANTTKWNGLTFVASASSEFSAAFAAHKPMSATDNDWYLNGRTGWLQIMLPVPVYVDAVIIRNVRTSWWYEYFTEWSISGSNDGVTFTTLLKSNKPPQWGGTFHKLTSPGYYKWVRFNEHAGVGTNCGLSIFRIITSNSLVATKLHDFSPVLLKNSSQHGLSVYSVPPGSLTYFVLVPTTWTGGTNLYGHIDINRN